MESENSLKLLRVAIVHDWLVDMGGAEKVLASILKIFPDADVYTLVCGMEDAKLNKLGITKSPKTSFIQKLPFATKKYRSYFPLMPLAIQQLDLSEYDLVVSSSYCVAKGVLTGPNQVHISYCHSPVRYAWDLQFQYLKEGGVNTGFKSAVARYFLFKLRTFDVWSSNAVDDFVANSQFIKKRIEKLYRRKATVIHPPVDVSSFGLCEEKSDYYFTCSRMVPYKRIDLIVEAFKSMPDKKLVVVGDGPDFEKVSAVAGENVDIKGFVEYPELISIMKHAKAFVYAAEEDFGIVPVEAQACGTPVICYGRGGVLDTVVEGSTGIYFKDQTCEAIVEAIRNFEAADQFDYRRISEHAKSFSEERFLDEFTDHVISKVTEAFGKIETGQ